ALPFRTEAFPEEATRLHACEAVSNRLLLQLLKHERVMQGGGQKVRQRVHDQNILRRKRVLLLALHVQDAQKGLAITDGDAEHSTGFGKQRLQRAMAGTLHQRGFTGTRHTPKNARAQRDALAQNFVRGSRFGANLDVFGYIVENSNANMVIAKILLDLRHDVGEHLGCIFAGNRGLRNIVEEPKLPGPALLFGKQSSVLDGYRK